jgi:hypothetical protein
LTCGLSARSSIAGTISSSRVGLIGGNADMTVRKRRSNASADRSRPSPSTTYTTGPSGGHCCSPSSSWDASGSVRDCHVLVNMDLIFSRTKEMRDGRCATLRTATERMPSKPRNWRYGPMLGTLPPKMKPAWRRRSGGSGGRMASLVGVKPHAQTVFSPWAQTEWASSLAL